MIKEEIYIEILNNIHSAVYIVDEDGKVLYINHAVELMDNVKAEEVIGKYILDIYNDNQFEKGLESPTIVALRDKEYLHDGNLEWKSSGRIVHALTSVIPIIENGERKGVITIADDVSVMKKRIIEHLKVEDKVVYKPEIKKLENGTRYVFSDIVGNSSVMWNAIETAKRFAARNMPIMLYGETGTGKEMFAQCEFLL